MHLHPQDTMTLAVPACHNKLLHDGSIQKNKIDYFLNITIIKIFEPKAPALLLFYQPHVQGHNSCFFCVVGAALSDNMKFNFAK